MGAHDRVRFTTPRVELMLEPLEAAYLLGIAEAVSEGYGVLPVSIDEPTRTACAAIVVKLRERTVPVRRRTEGTVQPSSVRVNLPGEYE